MIRCPNKAKGMNEKPWSQLLVVQIINEYISADNLWLRFDNPPSALRVVECHRLLEKAYPSGLEALVVAQPSHPSFQQKIVSTPSSAHPSHRTYSFSTITKERQLLAVTLIDGSWTYMGTRRPAKQQFQPSRAQRQYMLCPVASVRSLSFVGAADYINICSWLGRTRTRTGIVHSNAFSDFSCVWRTFGVWRVCVCDRAARNKQRERRVSLTPKTEQDSSQEWAGSFVIVRWGRRLQQ